MKLEHVTLEQTNCFAPVFLDYIDQKSEIKPFYQSFPKLENFKGLLKTRQLSDSDRTTLVEVLARQYAPYDIASDVDYNIHSLRSSNTFTVTTGHQLNIFTGPLYFIYKIASVIRTCQELRKAYPEYHFVPVYWMATEDHDAAEISYFNLFGKKYQWNTSQKGPVGRFKPLTLNAVIDELPESADLFEKAYLNHETLADAVRFYVNELFGDQGLVVVDADQKELKQLFAPIMEKEILDGQSNKLVEQQSAALEKAGYKSQAFSRDINFFYMESQLRERIVREGDVFKVLNTDKVFSLEEMQKLIQTKPQCFSPNVIMRPLYQERILPNLAYIGGPAEIAYWLQLKPIFDHYEIAFPALMPRNFVLFINKANAKKTDKLQLKPEDLFKTTHQLKEAYLLQHGENGYVLNEEKAALEKVFQATQQKAGVIDKSLEGFVGAEGAKGLKLLENIEKRLKKAAETNNETAMAQIDTIKEKLFPGGNLQERHDNFLNFYLNNPNFIKEIMAQLDPFDFRFHVLSDA